jgi:hypothetical protein
LSASVCRVPNRRAVSAQIFHRFETFVEAFRPFVVRFRQFDLADRFDFRFIINGFSGKRRRRKIRRIFDGKFFFFVFFETRSDFP